MWSLQSYVNGVKIPPPPPPIYQIVRPLRNVILFDVTHDRTGAAQVYVHLVPEWGQWVNWGSGRGHGQLHWLQPGQEGAEMNSEETVKWTLNPSNAKTTTIQSTRMQRFLKNIETLSWWYSLDGSRLVLSDEYPCARFLVIYG